MAFPLASKIARVTMLLLNVLDFILLTIAVLLLFSWSNWPLLITRICEILVAERYRWKTSKFIRTRTAPGSASSDKKVDLADSQVHCCDNVMEMPVISCVVGWREEVDLFTACLLSLRKTRCVSGFVVGIDGDSDDDLGMLDVVKQVGAA